MADNTVTGTSGDDNLETPNNSQTNEVYGGDGNDFIVDGGSGTNIDTFYGGAGNDTILAAGGNDILSGGAGDDSLEGSGGDDTFLIEDGFGLDTIAAGEFSETTGDVVDASAMTTDAVLTFGIEITNGGGGGPPGGGGGPPGGGPPGGGDGDGGDGDGSGDGDGGGSDAQTGATLESGAGNTAEIQGVESYILGSGNDTVIDDAGDNVVNMGAGDDTFVMGDDFGADTITGGNGGETLGDVIDAIAVTADQTVTFTADGTGTLTDGVSTLTFNEIERIETGAGNDTIYDSVGDQSIDGNDGDDRFFFGDNAGNDFFRGGTGGETTGDILDGSARTSGIVITYTGNSATMTDGTSTAGFTEIEEVILGAGDDTVTGDTGNESLTSGAGNDTFAVNENFGTDTVDLGSGSNTVDGSALTNDAVVSYSADGVGTLTSGANTVNFTGGTATATGSGNDTFVNSTHNETVYTNAGDDTLSLADGFGNDFWDAGEGSEITGDRLFADGLSGNTTITMSGGGGGTLTSGTNTLTFANVEEITTGNGDDTITGDNADNTIIAGTGNDSFAVTDGFGTDIYNAGEGGDAATGDNLDASALTNDATVTFSGSETGTLTDGANSVTFTSVEVVVTGDGDDTIISGTGNGENAAFTSGGDDTLQLSNGFDGATLLAGETNETSGDTVDASALTGDVDVTFTNDGEGVVTSGTDNAQFFEVENIVTGSGDDTITGGTGGETIVTNAGDDTFNVADNFGNDSFDAGETGETTGDRIDATAATAGLTVNLSAAETGTITQGGNSLSFSGVESIATGSGGDTISGSTGDDVLETNGGNDRLLLDDNFGTDTIDAGTGTDRIDASAVSSDISVNFSSAANGTLTNGANTASFTSVEQLRTGSGDDTITGTSGNESIATNDGDDTFIVTDNFGDDIFNAGPGGESTGDTLDASALTTDATVSFSSAEDGTLVSGSDSVAFSDVENIVTGSGDDTFTGSSGSENIIANSGDDTFNVVGNFGNDSFDAGETGETTGDTINVSTSDDITADFAGTLSAGGNTLNFSDVEILNTGTGDDAVTGSSENETVNSIQGDDTFIVADGFGEDVFNAGEGGISFGDTLDGSALTDDATVNFTVDEDGTLTTGAGNTVTFTNLENIVTGSGNDVVTGSSGGEDIATGAGNDTINGNAGRDTIFAGAGDDRVTIAAGDSVDAGSGNDLFILEDTGESSTATINIDGGSETTTAGDVLRLGELADLSTLSTTDDGTGSLSGSVQLKDGTLLNFTDIETIESVICFTPGTMIATPHGPRDIAMLRVGDMVRTRDNGVKPIRWIQRRTVPATGNFAPIRMRPGVIAGLTQDLIVSPQHRMLFQGYRAELLFGEPEVLVSATHLVDGKDVTQDDGGEVTYIHMMFDAHEIVYANGAASESFHPGTVGLTGVTDAAREELFRLFPELRSDPNGYGQTARRCLRKHETHLLSVS